MQRANYQQATLIEAFHPRLESCDDGNGKRAANDDEFEQESGALRWSLLLLVNVIGGGLLLVGMLFLPHLLGAFVNSF
jgi:hypothetical protein